MPMILNVARRLSRLFSLQKNSKHFIPHKLQNRQGPPDLDESIKQLMRGLFGSGDSKSADGNDNEPSLFQFASIVLVFAAIAWVGFGFYKVEELEQGVILKFGAFDRIEGPGLHWRMYGIEKPIRVNVSTVFSQRFAGTMLTQDENIVVINDLETQYRIEDPKKYLFSVVNPENTIGHATESAMRSVVGQSKMDDIISTGREKVEFSIRQEIERLLAYYQTGIRVVDINYQNAQAPAEVQDAFDDVTRAREDEERYVKEAEGYARKVQPVAEGQAQRKLEEAEAYRDKAIATAQGQVARFEKLLPEYESAPEVTKKRLYLESMQSVYSKTSKVIIDESAGKPLLYLPVDELTKRRRSKDSSAQSNGSSRYLDR